MKEVFLDKGKMVAIKVFKSKQDLEREFCGLKSFARFAKVPKVERLDCKVAKIELLNGFLGYQIVEEDLEAVVANFLQKIQPIKVAEAYSIMAELDSLGLFFADNPKLFGQVQKIKKQLQKVELFPVHGDLQKQNMVVASGELGLIDFEHFLFAPRELELTNSLFFCDGNCLDVNSLINQLPDNFLDLELLKLMLNFYGLKQIKQGMGESEAKSRLAAGISKINGFKKVKVKTEMSLGSFKSLCYL